MSRRERSPETTAAILATRSRLRAFVAQRVPAGVDPDDVVQDVLTRLLEHSDDVPPGRVQAWALTTARNAIVDVLRRRRPGALNEALVPAPAPAADATDLAACMRPLLDTLPAADRQVLEDVDATGGSQAQLARRLGVTGSTVKSRVQRARRRLRLALERCCAIELDTRGRPLDARRRAGRTCGGCGDREDAP